MPVKLSKEEQWSQTFLGSYIWLILHIMAKLGFRSIAVGLVMNRMDISGYQRLAVAVAKKSEGEDDERHENNIHVYR